MKMVPPFFALLIFCSSCGTNPPDGLHEAMERYDAHMRTMSADSIAAMYSPDGRLGEVEGPTSIREFLKTFSNINMLKYETKTISINVYVDSVVQAGRYEQVVVVSPPDTLHLTGTFNATWVNVDKRWFVKRMGTTPDR